MFLKEERYNIQQAKGSNSGVFKQTVSQSKLIRKRRYGSKEADLLYFIRGCRDCQGSNLENLIKKIKELIENEGVSINYQDGDGDTFLHAAIVENIPDVASLLLDNGINVNIRNNKGETPLQLAIKEHSSDSQWDAGIKRLEELSKADQNKGLLSPDGQQALENSSSEFISKTLDDKDYKAWLMQEDIANIARTTYEWYGESSNVVFEVIGSPTQLGKQLEQYEDKLKEPNKQSLTFIVNLDNLHWVTLVITCQNQQFSAYYIDSSGKDSDIGREARDNILGELNKKIAGIDIQLFDIKQQDDGYNCGILALMNAKIINDALQNAQYGQQVEWLLDYKLTEEQLRDKRIEFARKLEELEVKNTAQQLFVNIPKPGSDIRSQPIPTAADRVAKWSGWYTEEQIKTNPNLLFLFGDNDQAKYRTDKSNPGGGGQAQATRPTGNGRLPFDRLPKDGGLNGNAIGITTTYGRYTPNLNEFKALMDKEFEPIKTWVKKGGSVVVPCNDQGKHNLGTGIANLKDKIPGAIEYIQSKVDELVRLGQQSIHGPQSESLDTLKQELHKTLLVERQSYQSHKGLKNYLSASQPLVQRPQLKRTDTEPDGPNSKKLKEERGMKRPHTPERSVRTKIPKKDFYIASGLKLSLPGTVYQLKLLMLFVKRGIDKGYTFRLATEMDAAEKFDDVVFQYNEGGREIYRFLQAKHKEDESKKISVNDLLTEKDDILSLQKYFISYRKIKQKPEFADQGKDFIIYINTNLSSNLRNSFEQVKEEDDFLDTRPESKCLKLKIDKFPKKEDLITVLKGTSDLNRLAKILASYTRGNKSLDLRDELLKTYHGVLAEKIVNLREDKEGNKPAYYAEFRDDFLDDSSSELKNFREAFFKAYSVMSKKQEDKSEFWKKMKTIKLARSKDFGVVFKPDVDPYLTDPQRLAEAIADLIGKANQGIVTVKRDRSKKGIIKNNIEKLAGHILIKRDGEEKDTYYFSSVFFDDGKTLPGNLGVFRSKLKARLTSRNIKFDKDQYKFHIANFLTCEEGQVPVYNLPNDYVTEEEIKDFFEKLVFAVNQPNEIELGKIIREELGEEFNNIDSKNVYSRFLEEVLDWMKEKEGRFFTAEEGKEFFNKMREEILGNFRFNVRNPVELFTGRRRELEKLQELVKPGKTTIISQAFSISGLGGVGKTELVRKYIAEHGKDYDNNVIWINAETYEAISLSFRNFASSLLGINVKHENVEHIVTDVYNFFKSRKSLFIFDNAEKLKSDGQDKGIEQFLPHYFLSYEDNLPTVLITSRNREWGRNIQVLKLNVLNETEAIKFVKDALEIKDGLQDGKIKELIEKLECFPLALQQAAAYIREKDKDLGNVEGKFKISDYLEVFESKAEELLDFSFPDDSSDKYTKTTFATWEITLELIKTKEYGDKALEILNIMGYFSSNNIESSIFLELFEEPDTKQNEKLGAAIQLLKKYSMVDSEKNDLNIHRLVQEVTRLKLQDEGKEEKVLEETLDLIEKINNANQVEEKDLKHFMSVWEYSSKYDKLVEKFVYHPYYITERLNFYSRYEEAGRFGNKALELLEEKFEGVEKQVIRTLNYEIGKTLVGKGEYYLALEKFEKLERHLTSADYFGATLRISIALQYLKLEDYEKALGYIEDTIQSSTELVKKKLVEETLSTYQEALNTKAKILFALGKHINAIESLGYNKFLPSKKRKNFAFLKDKIEKYLESDSNNALKERKYLLALIESDLGDDDQLKELKSLLKNKEEDESVSEYDYLLAKHEVAKVLSNIGKYKEALEFFEEVIAESKNFWEDGHPDILAAEHEIAVVLDRQGKYEEAHEQFETLLKKATEVKKNDNYVGSRHVRKVQLGISIVLAHRGRYDDALIRIKALEEELQILKLPQGDLENVRIQNVKGLILSYQGEYEDAFKIFSHVPRLNTIDNLFAEREMAMIRLKQKRYTVVYNMFKNLINGEDCLLGSNHLDPLFTKYGIAMLYLLYAGKYDIALEKFQEVLEKREEVLGADHPDTLVVRCGIAMALSHQGKYDIALEKFQEVLEKREEVLGIDHPDTLVTRYEIAMTLSHQGKYDIALEKFQEVLEKRKKVLGHWHPDTLATEYKVVMLLAYQNEYDKALEQLKDTAKERKAFLKKNKKDPYGDHGFLSIERKIAMLLEKQEKHEEALKQLQDTAEGRRKFLVDDKKDPYSDHDFLSIEHKIAMLLEKQEKHKEALKQLQDTAEGRRKFLSINKDNPFFDYSLLSTEYEIAMIYLLEGNINDALKKFEKVLNGKKENLKDDLLSMHDRQQLSELQNKLETLKQQGHDVDKLVKLVKKVLQINDKKHRTLLEKSECNRRKVKKKRDVSEMPCIDSRGAEDITSEEKEQLKKLENEISNKVLSRYEEIESVATYDVNKRDVLSNALQSLKLSKMLLLMSQKSEVSIELQKKAYYNALIDIGALIYDYKNHVHGDHLSALEGRVQGNQLFSVAHDLYYLLKNEGNVDQDKLYSDQVKSKISSYVENENRLDYIYGEFNIVDIEGYFSDHNVKDFDTEVEAYDKEVITIHSTQVFADEVKVCVEVKDSNGDDQKLVIGEIASVQNIENYILDDKTSEIKLRIDDDKEYTITQELEEGHVKHHLNIPGGYKVKVGNIISSFTEDKKEAIHSKLHRLELLASKKDIEEISNAEITDQDYNNGIDEIKQSLLQKGVSEGTFNQLKDHLDSLGKKVFAEYISDVEKKLEGHGIEFDRNKFDSAKVKGAKGGKFFSFVAIYDLFDSIRDVPTLGRHDNDALKKIFGINGILDAINDVRESLSVSTYSDGKVVTKISRDSAIGKVVSKIPDSTRKNFVKIINNPVVQSITFATIAYQFGYSINEIAKGNHHPLNYYWAGSSGTKLASMSTSVVAKSVAIGGTTKALRGVFIARKVLSKLSLATMGGDILVSIGMELHERMEYTKKIAGEVPLLPGNEQAEVFLAKPILLFTGRDVEKEYEKIIKAKGCLNSVKEEAIKLLKNNPHLAGVVWYVSSITEMYGEEIETYDKEGSGVRGPMARQNCNVRKVPHKFSFGAVDRDYSELPLLNRSQHMISHTLVMSEAWERFLCTVRSSECLQELDEKNVYIVSTDAKHIPHLTKREYEELGFRIVSAPLKVVSDFKYKDEPYVCNPGKTYRIHTNVFAFSSEPFIFIKTTIDSSFPMLYLSGPNRLTAVENYPAVMVVPEGGVDYRGSTSHDNVFIINDKTYGDIRGGAANNTIVMNYNTSKIFVNLNGQVIRMDGLQINLFNIYDYVSHSTANQNITTSCKTTYIDARNAVVRQSSRNCEAQDYEVRVVNEGTVHYRGLKQAVFVISENSNNAKIVSDMRNTGRIKENTDTISVNVTDIKQLMVSEEKEGGYSLNLLANNTQSTVSSVKIDSFENLVIQVEDSRMKGVILIQNKSLSDIMEDMRHQMLSDLTNVDEGVVQNSEKKLKAVIQVNIHSPELSTYSVARDIANDNNLGIPISQIEVIKNHIGVPHEKVIIGSMYSDKITIDFGNNSNVANSDEEGYGYKCSYYQNIIVEGGNRYIIKLPEYNHTLKREILESPVFNLNLEIKSKAEDTFYDIVDLSELGTIDVNNINITKGKRSYFSKCYSYSISDLTEDSLEIKNVTVSNDEGIKWSLSVGLVDYFRSSKHQFIALEMNGKFYIINNKDLKLEHVESDPSSFKRYQPDERGLQIYNNQPINNDDTIIINLRDKSILDFDMEVVGSLILSSRNNTIVQVENWSTYQPARKMMFVFYEIILSNAKCMKFDCNPEDIVEEFEKEKAKLVNKKGADVNAENSRGNAPLEADNPIMGIFPEERRNEESTRRHKRHHIRHEHHHKGHRNPPIQEVTSSAARSSSWINVFANTIVDAVKGVFQFISSPFKPAIGGALSTF